MDQEAQRRALLAAALAHVPFDGWTRKALLAGASDLGIAPELALNTFPGGPSELIEAFSLEADRQMLVELERLDLEAMKVRERIATAVKLRFEALAPHREAVRRGLAFFAQPINAPLGLTCLHRSVDAIWYAAGDKATDYNYYSKRLLLAGVMSATLLVWLDDRSENHATTWQFLDRRLDEVIAIGGRLGRGMKALLDLPDRLIARRRAFRR